jgi:hypothetical protein
MATQHTGHWKHDAIPAILANRVYAIHAQLMLKQETTSNEVIIKDSSNRWQTNTDIRAGSRQDITVTRPKTCHHQLIAKPASNICVIIYCGCKRNARMRIEDR